MSEQYLVIPESGFYRIAGGSEDALYAGPAEDYDTADLLVPTKDSMWVNLAIPESEEIQVVIETFDSAPPKDGDLRWLRSQDAIVDMRAPLRLLTEDVQGTEIESGHFTRARIYVEIEDFAVGSEIRFNEFHLIQLWS